MSVYVVKILHVAFAAAWFGVPLGAASMIKRGLAQGEREFRLAASEGARKGRISMICGLLTFATGVLAVFQAGGFGAIGRNIHLSMGLVVVMIALGFLVMKPAGDRLVALSEVQPLNAAEAQALIKRLFMGSGVLQLLWMVVLSLMIWPLL